MASTLQIDRLLETCVRRSASDLHLAVGKPPTLRLHGHLRELQTKVLEPEDTMALMKSVTPERIQQEFEETGSGDFGFAFGTEARFRVSVFKQKGVASLVLRRIPNKLLTFEQIGLPDMAEQICRRPRGIFLVTGPTGSGKTTTLACMINHINENFDRHIITMEDPIEYYHQHKKSIVVQREIGVDVPSFSEALRRALRQDPDVMLVGEMRDLATIGSAITAAETGHLVFGTLHTSGAASTINRIIDAFPTDQQEQVRVQLANNLIAVLSQALCPRVRHRRHGRRLRIHVRHPRHSEPHPRKQGLPHRLRNPDRQTLRHAACSTTPSGPFPGRENQHGRGHRQEQSPRPDDGQIQPQRGLDVGEDSDESPDDGGEASGAPATPQALGRRRWLPHNPPTPSDRPRSKPTGTHAGHGRKKIAHEFAKTSVRKLSQYVE